VHRNDRIHLHHVLKFSLTCIMGMLLINEPETQIQDFRATQKRAPLGPYCSACSVPRGMKKP
jgi:hypothetical protein